MPGAAPPAPTGARTTEPLEGRWYDGQGGYFEFTRAGDSYRLEEVGVLGKVGEGKADLVGDLVRIHSRNRLLGDYSMELRRSGETLSGHFRMLGMALPFTLTRR